MKTCSAAALLALAACGPEVIALDIPIAADTKSVVLALEFEGRLEVVAVELAGLREGALPHHRDVQGDLRATALLYDRTLSELGLAAGPLLFESDRNHAHALPLEAQVYETSIAGSSVAEWKSSAEPNEAIRAFRRTGPPHCRELEVRVVDIAGRATAAIAPIDAETALVALAGGSLVRVGASSSTPIPIPITSRARGEPIAAHHTGDGSFWIATIDGELWSGDLTAGFTRAASAPEGVVIDWMTGSRAPAPFELYTLSSSAAFARFDGSAWELLSAGTVTANNYGAIAWRSAGAVLAGAGFDTPLIDYDRSNPIRALNKHILPFASGTFTTVADIEGIGVLVPTDLGRVLRFDRRGATWSELTISPIDEKLMSLMPVDGGGVLMIGNRAALAYYHPQFGFCPVPDPPEVPISVRGALRLEGGLSMIIGKRVESDEQSHALVLSAGSSR